jgi:hypothetical protein
MSRSISYNGLGISGYSGYNGTNGTSAAFSSTGSSGYVVKYTGATNIGNSLLYDNGTSITYPGTWQIQQTYESMTINSAPSATNGVININLLSGSSYFNTTSAVGPWGLNFIGTAAIPLSTSLVSGRSVTTTFLNTNGATAYYLLSAYIDSAPVTIKWQNALPPTNGNANSIDLYVFTIIMTSATPTYTVIGSQVRYA